MRQRHIQFTEVLGGGVLMVIAMVVIFRLNASPLLTEKIKN